MAVSMDSVKTPIDLLQSALTHERDAYLFYTRALLSAGSGPVRDVIEQLKDAEYRHVQLIENMISTLKFG